MERGESPPRFGASRAGTFRVRMIRLLTFALMSVLVPLGFLIAGQVGQYHSALGASRTVAGVQQIQALIHELQKERGLSVGLLGGDGRFRAKLGPQRESSDAALAQLRARADEGLAGAADVRAALAPLDSLAATRAAVDQGTIDRAGTLRYYTDAIAALNGLDIGADATADSALQRGLAALTALGDAKEYTGRERAVLSGVFAARHFGQGDYVLLLDDLAGKQAAFAQFARSATAAQRAELAAAQQSATAQTAAADESVAVGSDGAALPRQVDPLAWFATMTAYIDQLRQVQIEVGTDIDARAAALRASAAHRLVWIILLSVLALGAEGWLGISAARSVLGPLARLVREARDLASRKLPQAVERLRYASEADDGDDAAAALAPVSIAVPARAGTEIAAVAAALDSVQAAALALATGQAALRRDTNDSLVNLARRHQNLVRRQLALITRLEADELDPDLLGALFELDHLATRMRRNAESLLVLVGHTTARRWAEPVPASDLVRAAMSEVDDFPRVEPAHLDPARVTGAVAAELAHLLAELLENALIFSPPHTPVRVAGRRGDAGYTISIADQGIGMSAAALAAANGKLSAAESFDVAPTRFLGHHVVGQLARRLGAQVALTSEPGAGTTAVVLIPTELLADGGEPPGATRVGAVLTAFSSGHRRGAQASRDPFPSRSKLEAR
jgi:signal transduction histidine kinase